MLSGPSFQFVDAVLELVDPALSAPNNEKNHAEEDSRDDEYDHEDEQDYQEFRPTGNDARREYVHEKIETGRAVRRSGATLTR